LAGPSGRRFFGVRSEISSPAAEQAAKAAAPPEEQRPASEPLAAPGGHGGPPRRFVGRDLTSGSIPKNLWGLAWPQMIESVLNVVDQLADLLWAGRLGTRYVAGLGVSQTYVMTAMTGRMGFDTAMRAMVSRAVGAGDLARANHVALQAFTLSGAFSLMMALIGVFFTEPLLRLLGVPENVIDAGAMYMRIQFVGMAGMAFRMMSGAALQASGDTITPMKATTVTRVIHIALSPALVFGWGPLPAMALAGAATANVLSQFVGASMNFRALFIGTSRLHLTLTGYRPDFPLLWQIVKTGLPASITQAERNLASLILFGLVAPYGATTLAAFALTRRVEMLAMMGAMGMGQSAGVMVGQNLGAGQPERAKASVVWALFFVTLISSLVVGMMLAFPKPFLQIFNNDPELLDQAIVWLRIQALGYLVMGSGMVFMQSYNTAGDTLVPMITTLVSIWGVQQPLALLLPGLGLGAYGIAWAIVIGMAVRLGIYVPYFFYGRWLRIKF
jgi:putative MATE family efflux protein